MGNSSLSRRHLLLGIGVTAAMSLMPMRARSAAPTPYPLRHTDAEWRRLLTPAQYRILRQEGTEPPFSSPLLGEHRRGSFVCAADGNPLFASATKFESGTGWPSFFRPLPGGVGTSTDRKLGYARTEVHCARCGGHLGHVFDDGPPPTGKRYCMNGDALRFVPA
ncbi:MAG: peptide-methionine (R)-S-oxide reductase MsrB [Novosphingobium sp.]